MSIITIKYPAGALYEKPKLKKGDPKDENPYFIEGLIKEQSKDKSPGEWVFYLPK